MSIATQPKVLLEQITKRFGSTLANDGVDLELYAGEIHALLGENGAGKTTLMKVLSGFYRPDGGRVLVDGVEAEFASPREALDGGIGMVHQHYRLIEKFTVGENLHLGWDATPFTVSRSALNEQSLALASRYRLAIRPDTPVWQLSIGEKQAVELLRILARDVRVLILDEPTAVLAPEEASALLDNLRELAAAGTTVVIITHRLREVMKWADRVTVLRLGQQVGTLTVSGPGVDENLLAGMMVGTDRMATTSLEGDAPARALPAPGDVLLEARNISANDDRGLPQLKDVSFVVREGELVGVAGVAGNGQRELGEVLTGLRRATAGELYVSGTDFSRAGPLDLIRGGMGHIPEDRQGAGLAQDRSITENAILKAYRSKPIRWGWFVRNDAARRYASKIASTMNLAFRGLDQPAGQLSGGNAQRLLIGREMSAAEKVLIAMHPTRGLDVRAAADVRSALLEARSKDLAVLLISDDLDEVLAIADRVIVLYAGRIVGEFRRPALDRHMIGSLMGGAGMSEI